MVTTHIGTTNVNVTTGGSPRILTRREECLKIPKPTLVKVENNSCCDPIKDNTLSSEGEALVS